MGETLKVGLLGYGTVGSEVGHILEKHSEMISMRVGATIEVSKVLVRDATRARKNPIPAGASIETDISAILDDPELDILVEVMGGIDPAYGWIRAALEAGKHVVTANKELIAVHGGELLDLARDNSADLYFEAAVAGGIPVIHPLREALVGNRIELIMGIVNGTTNYILTQMEQGNSYEAALKEAQELGYAEADPSADVDGHDAAAKISILASIAFGSRVTPDDVFTEGISRLSIDDLAYAEELGWVIKLIGLAKRVEGGVDVRVHPTLLPGDHPLAAVKDEFNAIFIVGDSVGKLMFYGQGAGGPPTASAVVGDVIDVARNCLAGATGMLGCTCFDENRVIPIDEVVSSYYLRTTVLDRPGVLAKIASAFGRHDVSLAKVLQMQTLEEDRAELVMVTHESQEANVRKALEEIDSLEEVVGVESLIRAEITEGN